MVPVFALRRNADMGIGDTLAVEGAIDFCAQHGIKVLQLLPINETSGDNSPYNAISSIALEPCLLNTSPGFVPGLTQAHVDEIAPAAIIDQLKEGPVQYSRVKRLKFYLLSAAFAEFEATHLKDNSAEAQEFAQFKESNASWLHPYTLFRTLVREHKDNSCWAQWGPEVQTLSGAESWLSASPRAEELQRWREFFAYVQWVAFRQWQHVHEYALSRKVGLMGDIPFGVSRYSADVWAERFLFNLDWYGGAPPEKFFVSDEFVRRWGQNWGIPLFDWAVHESQDFAWWKQRVQCTTRIFDYFRIDHVLGFFRVYAFPWPPDRNFEYTHMSDEEAASKHMGHLPKFFPHNDEPRESAELNAANGYKLMSKIMEFAGDCGVVAEDLGVVPYYVRPMLTQMGIPGFTIPIFEREEPSREFIQKDKYSEINLVTHATHDHQPIKTIYVDMVMRWHGPDGDEHWVEMQRLMRFLGMDPFNPPTAFTNEVHEAFIRALMFSKGWLSLSMITDILGTTQRFNEPGLSAESNWSERLDRPLDQFAGDPIYGRKIEMYARLIKESGRS